jgi:hypothetical protein
MQRPAQPIICPAECGYIDYEGSEYPAPRSVQPVNSRQPITGEFSRDRPGRLSIGAEKCINR